jgi:hypothetical protein
MNDSACFMRRRPRARPSAARTATAVTTVVLVLLAAACSDGPSSTGSGGSSAGGSAGSPSAIAYSSCMRSQGVPNYPDPDSSGQLPKGDAQHYGVSTCLGPVASGWAWR